MKNILFLFIVLLMFSGCDKKESVSSYTKKGNKAFREKGLKRKNPLEQDDFRRIALVVGNNAYNQNDPNFLPLRNAVNDAVAMKERLERFGFEVTLLKNAQAIDFNYQVLQFGAKLRKGGTGLFFYSGHGVQHGGINYFIPVQTYLQRAYELKEKAVSMKKIVQEMQHAGNRFNMIIVDACRNELSEDFLPREKGQKKSDSSFTSMKPPKGMCILFATAENRSALEKTEDSLGVFTKYFVRSMAKENVPLWRVFQETSKAVAIETKNAQIPWIESSGVLEFYFNPVNLEQKIQRAKKNEENKIEKELLAVRKKAEQKKASILSEVEKFKRQKEDYEKKSLQAKQEYEKNKEELENLKSSENLKKQKEKDLSQKKSESRAVEEHEETSSDFFLSSMQKFIENDFKKDPHQSKKLLEILEKDPVGLQIVSDFLQKNDDFYKALCFRIDQLNIEIMRKSAPLENNKSDREFFRKNFNILKSGFLEKELEKCRKALRHYHSRAEPIKKASNLIEVLRDISKVESSFLELVALIRKRNEENKRSLQKEQGAREKKNKIIQNKDEPKKFKSEITKKLERLYRIYRAQKESKEKNLTLEDFFRELDYSSLTPRESNQKGKELLKVYRFSENKEELLTQLRKLVNLTVLEFPIGSYIDEEFFIDLARLKNIKVLKVSFSRHNTEEVNWGTIYKRKRIQKSGSLETLTMNCRGMTLYEIESLANFPNLKNLTLEISTPLETPKQRLFPHKSGFKFLEDLKSLKSFRLYYKFLARYELDSIKDIPNLEHLSLSHLDFLYSKISGFPFNQRFKSVEINSAERNTFNSICGINSLDILRISLGDSIGLDGIMPLRRLKQLKYLTLRVRSLDSSDFIVLGEKRLNTLDLTWGSVVENQDYKNSINQLAYIKNLRISFPSNFDPKDIDFSKFPKAKKVESLELRNINLSWDHVVDIAQTSSIKKMSLENVTLAKGSILILLGMKPLQELRISSIFPDRKDFELLYNALDAISGNEKIRFFRIEDLNISKSRFKMFSEMKNLERLEVSLKSSPEVLEEIHEFKFIKQLKIEKTALTAKHIESLSKLTNLKRLELQQNIVTIQQLYELRSALPICDVLLVD